MRRVARSEFNAGWMKVHAWIFGASGLASLFNAVITSFWLGKVLGSLGATMSAAYVGYLMYELGRRNPAPERKPARTRSRAG
jgi:hypothetical protein